jgi:predicted DNA-binding transcriptional regulator YafY
MSDLKEKLKRQTEILGLCLNEPRTHTQADLQILFGRDRPTITRDLTALRSTGIDIHSTKKGVEVMSRMPSEAITELILQYVGLSYSGLSYDKATTSLVRRLKEKALSTIVLLQRCIDHARQAMISYEKEPGHVEENRVIAPIILYQSDNEWRLLAENDGKRKQYLVCKIRSIVPTAKGFKRPSRQELRDLFLYSWNSWLGSGNGEQYLVRLRFDKESVRRYAHRQFVDTQKIIRNKDGSAILEAHVNILNEIAGWVVSRGSGVTVLEPVELRRMVVELAERALENHR